MKRDCDMVVPRDQDDWYVGTVSALPGCNTLARLLDELGVRMRQAIGVWIDAPGREPEPAEFVGMQRITIASRGNP